MEPKLGWNVQQPSRHCLVSTRTRSVPRHPALLPLLSDRRGAGRRAQEHTLLLCLVERPECREADKAKVMVLKRSALPEVSGGWLRRSGPSTAKAASSCGMRWLIRFFIWPLTLDISDAKISKSGHCGLLGVVGDDMEASVPTQHVPRGCRGSKHQYHWATTSILCLLLWKN